MLTGMFGAAIQAVQKAAASAAKGGASGSAGVSGGLSGGGSAPFDKDFDYAAAIARTTDAAERARLLDERQAKMDALGLNGKLGSNDTVQQALHASRPYWLLGGETSGGLSRNDLYDAAARSRLQAFETARSGIGGRLQSQYADIDAAYREGVTQTEVNARRSALAGEEKLAALGLSMGASLSAPTSGYTETSRVAMDNAYRADLAGLSQARLGARSAAAQAAADRESSLIGGYYSGEAAAALAEAQARLGEMRAERDYSISVAGLTGFYNGLPTVSYHNAQAQMQASAEQTAYERAMGRWKTYGYVLPADAALLGVAAGTPTSDQSYRAAQLGLNQIRTNYQINK